MSVVPDQPCAQPGCGCKVQKAGQYCSDPCRQQKDAPAKSSCKCGHSDCVVEEALERADAKPR